MSKDAWTNWHECAINEASRGDVDASSPALDIGNLNGGYDMPADRHYTDSAPAGNPEQTRTMGMTRRQSDALFFITSYYERFGISPSYSEIMEAMGLRSTSSVFRIVTALKARGHVVSTAASARSLRPVKARMPLAPAIYRVLDKCDLTSQTRTELEALLDGEVTI